MNKVNIKEIRRHLTFEKHNISSIIGCFVNEKKEKVSEFYISPDMFQQDELEKYLKIFRKVLSGTYGRNLINISFPQDTISGSNEYSVLESIRKESVKDNENVKVLFDRIISTFNSDKLGSGYVILLASDIYDISFKNKKAEEFSDIIDTTFRFFLCAVCPIKLSKSMLVYRPDDKNFHSAAIDLLLTNPLFGFMYPRFEGNGADINGAMMYNRDVKADMGPVANAVFKSALPMDPISQKSVFKSVLKDSLGDDCNIDVVNSIRNQALNVIEANKEIRSGDEPAELSKNMLRKTLDSCGVPEDKLNAFCINYDDNIGPGKGLVPENLTSKNRYEVRTPDVVIKVNPEKQELVDVKIINGIKYIIIRAEDGVEVNGMDISIKE